MNNCQKPSLLQKMYGYSLVWILVWNCMDTLWYEFSYETVLLLSSMNSRVYVLLDQPTHIHTDNTIPLIPNSGSLNWNMTICPSWWDFPSCQAGMHIASHQYEPSRITYGQYYKFCIISYTETGWSGFHLHQS